MDDLSLRQAFQMMRAARRREEMEWARTLRITAHWGDKMTVAQVFGGSPVSQQQQERVRQLQQEHYRIRKERGLA